MGFDQSMSIMTTCINRLTIFRRKYIKMFGWLTGSTPNPTVYEELDTVKDINDCKQVAEKLFQKILEADSAGDWNEISFEDTGLNGLDDIKLWDRDLEGTPVRAGKASGTLPIDPKGIFEKLWAYDVEWIKRFDSQLVSFVKILEEGDVQLVRTRMAAPMPLSYREFVTVRTKKVVGNVYYIYSVSVNYPTGDKDSDPSCVRGAVHINGFIIRPVEDNPNQAYVTRIVQMDPKGAVPLFVVDMMKRKAAEFVAKLREEVGKEQ